MTSPRLFALALMAVLCGSSALAQQSNSSSSSSASTASSPSSTTIRTQRFIRSGPGEPGPHADFRIGPPGMWWKNPDIIQKLNLTADQQKRMDDIFQQSRLQLIDLKANVEKQEVMLEPLLSANPPDTNKVLSQIDHVASARADLEKANARMLLGIRGVLSADQWTKLQAEQRENRRIIMHFDGPGGPGSMRGPGGPDGFSPHGPLDPVSQVNPIAPGLVDHLELLISPSEDLDFDI